jgi:uncharacterized protein YndB with AHSA1/START domain
MIDIPSQIGAIARAVGAPAVSSAEPSLGVTVTRRYPAPVEDVWDAIVDPHRLRRWFLPISGDLRVGGTFQLEGNAGGSILACEAPRLLRVTFGGEASVVEVRLTAEGDETLFELLHTVPLAMAGSAAGALFVGPGWDGGVMALALYLAGESPADPVEAGNSPEAQEFCRQSAHAWADVATASGLATADEIATALDASLKQFAPDLYQD